MKYSVVLLPNLIRRICYVFLFCLSIFISSSAWSAPDFWDLTKAQQFELIASCLDNDTTASHDRAIIVSSDKLIKRIEQRRAELEETDFTDAFLPANEDSSSLLKIKKIKKKSNSSSEKKSHSREKHHRSSRSKSPAKHEKHHQSHRSKSPDKPKKNHRKHRNDKHKKKSSDKMTELQIAKAAPIAPPPPPPPPLPLTAHEHQLKLEAAQLLKSAVLTSQAATNVDKPLKRISPTAKKITHESELARAVAQRAEKIKAQLQAQTMPNKEITYKNTPEKKETLSESIEKTTNSEAVLCTTEQPTASTTEIVEEKTTKQELSHNWDKLKKSMYDMVKSIDDGTADLNEISIDKLMDFVIILQIHIFEKALPSYSAAN